MAHALDAESLSSHQGLLQSLDPRIKLIALLALILAVVLVTSLIGLAALFAVALVLAFASAITAACLARQVWIGVLLFTGVIALPALVTVPGVALFELPLLGWPVTLQGARSAAFLVGRAETCATLALLLVLTTPWPHVLKALRALGVPLVLVAVLGMSHRYAFVLLQGALQLAEGRRSRTVGALSGTERRRAVANTAGVLLARALHLGSEVHLAMVSRGYRGEVRLLDDFRTRPRDWIGLLGALAVPALVLWLQR